MIKKISSLLEFSAEEQGKLLTASLAMKLAIEALEPIEDPQVAILNLDADIIKRKIDLLQAQVDLEETNRYQEVIFRKPIT